jgi:hypothetical protein
MIPVILRLDLSALASARALLIRLSSVDSEIRASPTVVFGGSDNRTNDLVDKWRLRRRVGWGRRAW